MKKKVLLVIFLFVFSALIYSGAAAQEDSTDLSTTMGDVLDIVQKSGHFDYHETFFDSAKLKAEFVKRLSQSNPNQVIVEAKDKRKITVFTPPQVVTDLIRKADDSLKNKNKIEALKTLEDAAKISPEYPAVYSKIENIYFKDQNYDEVVKWCNRAISANKADFNSYRLKAEVLIARGQTAEAKKALIQSIIYNRNNKEAFELLAQIGKKEGFTVYDEPFLPLYTVEKISNGKTRIYLDKDTVMRWMPYAFCKAVWRYEPGFFESKTGEKEYRLTVEEEQESLENSLWAYDVFIRKKTCPPDPLMERIKKIKARYFINEFINFEILAPCKPEILATLDDKQLADMADYINEFILVKKAHP